MIKEAKKAEAAAASGLVVNLHPDRPEYRGLVTGEAPFSLPADPSFEETKTAGATVQTSKETHTVLDNMFLISGEIPRLTPYESGIKHGVRYIGSENKWIKDELIMDERFVMCNIKGSGSLSSSA
jgi:7,8-dihydropterin-6-yl-methyl-4-(beta-D-ribofuranosyl)aminobenzene 5'-phosphate synthase